MSSYWNALRVLVLATFSGGLPATYSTLAPRFSSSTPTLSRTKSRFPPPQVATRRVTPSKRGSSAQTAPPGARRLRSPRRPRAVHITRRDIAHLLFVVRQPVAGPIIARPRPHPTVAACPGPPAAGWLPASRGRNP